MAEERYTARFELPTLIEQGRANALVCAVYRGSQRAVPTAGTVTVYDATATTPLVDAAAATITGGQATYSLSSGTVTNSTRGEGWRISWSLTMPDGVVHVFDNDAALVRRALFSVIGERDLFRRVSSLDPALPAPIVAKNYDYQDKIDEAFVGIQQALIAQGNRPNLVVSPSSLRGAHLALALALVFEDLATRLNPAYADRAKEFRNEYESEWAKLRFLYDTDDDGQPESLNRKAAHRVVWLNGRT